MKPQEGPPWCVWGELYVGSNLSDLSVYKQTQIQHSEWIASVLNKHWWDQVCFVEVQLLIRVHQNVTKYSSDLNTAALYSHEKDFIPLPK